ncbi:MAG TPA: dienelactone hydrolase family protein [Beijerinckiaceae bacterium]|nr:dienelactone hydrolase family protein [Beijerinckiaceae bacterium]
MLRRFLPLLFLFPHPANAEQSVTFVSRDATTLNARLFQPSGGDGKRPAIVLMHGCGGLARKDGALFKRHQDWAERFQAAGFVVVLPDSFASRGLASQCSVTNRAINPQKRTGDALGALDFLKARADVDPARIVLMGWSNGGSTVLRVAALAPETPGFARVIAFYPGCRPLLKHEWRAKVPTAILHGKADDWTPIEPCQELARIGGPVTIDVFEGATHGFDAPDTPLRQRKGLAFSKSGDGNATSGTHGPSRQQAINRVMELLRGP